LYISGDRFLDQEWLGFTKPLPQPKKYHSRRFIIPGLFERDYVLPQPMISHSDQPAIKKDSKNAVDEHIREVTAYNVGDPKQNYGNPCISANGENICAALDKGLRRCAANFVPFGTKLYIERFGFCTVTDRMNKRYKSRVDIAMKTNEKEMALKFGLKRLKVKIINLN
jgi:3D (Asp-Asp-Asp) domain-containing protein